MADKPKADVMHAHNQPKARHLTPFAIGLSAIFFSLPNLLLLMEQFRQNLYGLLMFYNLVIIFLLLSIVAHKTYKQ